MPAQPSPPDLVALARDQLAAVNRRDLETVLSILAADAVYDTSPSGMGTYVGHAAIGAFLRGYWETFAELRFELEEALDLGSGVTFLVNRQVARLPGSKEVLRTREAHVVEWADRKVARMTVYNEKIDEGRAAAERLASTRR
jgi:ketosteroid isomerase-like protein